MSNIKTNLIARIEARMTETKNPCKNYKTEAAADKAVAKIAADMMQIHSTKEPARYVTFEVPGLGWCGAVDLTEMMRRPDFGGGYIMYAGSKGFYSF